MSRSSFFLAVLFVECLSRSSAMEDGKDWFGECNVVSCSLETQSCEPESSTSETKFFHNGGLFYCPPDGEYDYITWSFDCQESVLLLPTTAEHRTIEGVDETSVYDMGLDLFRLGIRSTSREEIAIMIEPNAFFPPSTSELVPLYKGADEQLKSFLECNGEQLKPQARDGDGNRLNLTLEGPLPRFDDTIVDSCWENNSTCTDGFACAKCNEDKSVDLVRLVGYDNTTNRLIEGPISRTKRGSNCPIDPSIVYDDDYAYVYQGFKVNGFSDGRADIMDFKSHGESLLKNSEKIFSCRSSSTNVAPMETSKAEPPAGVEIAVVEDAESITNEDNTPVTAPTGASQQSNSSSPTEGSPEGEEVCLEVDWLRSIGVKDEQMLHKKSILTTVLCAGGGIPCGTADHLLLKDGALISFDTLCRREECEKRSALVNSANHLLLMRAPIHYEGLSVTGCSGKRGSWQRWIEEVVVRRVYMAHRAWNI